MTKLLIYRMGSLGDTVVALPVFHLLARVFRDAERRVLTNREIEAVDRRLSDWPGTDSFAAFSVGTKIDAKSWGDDNWTDLLKNLSALQPGLSWSGGTPPVKRSAEGETNITMIPVSAVLDACRSMPPQGASRAAVAT